MNNLSQKENPPQKNKKNKTIPKKPKLHNLSEKFNDDYISIILVPAKVQTKKEEYECKICPKNTLIGYKNIKRHLLRNETHSNRVPLKDKKLHSDLIEKVQKSIRSKEKKKEDLDTVSKGYLEFLALCLKSRCSFKQISEIGMGLKKMVREKNLRFLDINGFSEEEISHVTRCFGECLIEDLKADLSANKYSLCIDNSTIGGKSVTIIEAKYLKKEIINEIPHTKIMNKIVGVKYLNDSSTGETMYNIVKEKVLELDSEVKNNLIGLAHDLAANLTSEAKGLISEG